MGSKARDSRLITLLAIAAFLTATLKVVKIMGMDNDFFHLAVSGRDIVANRSIEYVYDGFVLGGYKTIVQQWAYCILLYLASKVGALGVFLFTYIQMLVLSFMYYKMCRVSHLSRETSLLIASATINLNAYTNCRPEMFSLILFFIQFIMLEKYRETSNHRYLYVLPMLTLLQVNFHGMFYPVNFVFLLPYLVPANKLMLSKTRIIDDNMKIKPFIIPVCLMVLSLFVNPYGSEMVKLPFYALSMPDVGIMELSKVTLTEGGLILAAIAIATAFVYKKGNLSSTSLYFSVGICVMYAYSVRNLMFLPVIMAFLFRDIKPDVTKNKSLYGIHRKAETGFFCYSIIYFLLCICLFATGIKKQPEDFLCECISGNEDHADYVRSAADYIISDSETSGNAKIYTMFDTGSYFLWKNAGKIYMQSKTEPYLKGVNGKEDILSEYKRINIYSDKGDIEDFLQKYEFDYLCIDTTEAGVSLQVYLNMSDSYELVMKAECGDEDGEGKYYLYKKIR